MNIVDNIDQLTQTCDRLVAAKESFDQVSEHFRSLANAINTEFVDSITWKNSTVVIEGETRYIKEAVFPEILGKVERQMDLVTSGIEKNICITTTFESIPGLVFTQTARTIYDRKLLRAEVKLTRDISFICSAPSNLDRMYNIKLSYNGMIILADSKAADESSVLYAAKQELLTSNDAFDLAEVPKQTLVADLIRKKVKLPKDIVNQIPSLAKKRQITVINSAANCLQVEIIQHFTTNEGSWYAESVDIYFPIKSLLLTVKMTHTCFKEMSQTFSCSAYFPVKSVTKKEIIDAISKALDKADKKN